MASDKLGPTDANGTATNGNGKNLINDDKLNTKLEKTLADKKGQSDTNEEFVKQTTGIMDIPGDTIEAFGGDELRARVFFEKYALRDKTGRIVEHKPSDMWQRVAREMATPEKTKELKKEWEENFFWLLSDFKFIPGGRIMFGAGQNRRATPVIPREIAG